MLIKKYEKLSLFMSSIHDSYARFYKSMDVMVRAHKISSISSLNEAKHKKKVQLDIDEYMD